MKKTIRQIEKKISILDELKAEYVRMAKEGKFVSVREYYADTVSSVQGEINTLNWVLGRNE